MLDKEELKKIDNQPIQDNQVNQLPMEDQLNQVQLVVENLELISNEKNEEMLEKIQEDLIIVDNPVFHREVQKSNQNILEKNDEIIFQSQNNQYKEIEMVFPVASSKIKYLFKCLSKCGLNIFGDPNEFGCYIKDIKSIAYLTLLQKKGFTKENPSQSNQIGINNVLQGFLKGEIDPTQIKSISIFVDTCNQAIDDSPSDQDVRYEMLLNSILSYKGKK